MMKHFWALPAFLRIVLASQHSFSVLDDLLAFPQYQVVFSDASAISEDQARSLYASTKQHDALGPDAPASTVELSQQTRADDGTDGAPDAFAHARPGEKAAHDDELAVRYERMMLHSQPYLCRVPVVDAHKGAANATAKGSAPSAADEEKELMRATDRGWQLLKGMGGNCIYFLSGWWSYSFCYNEGVKQFHQLPPSRGVPIYPPVEDETVQSYVLGQFPPGDARGKRGKDDEGEDVDDGTASAAGEETGVARLETKGETRYLVQKLTGGTTCDLTGKERKIEVQFHCHPNTPDRIGMIKEVATCSYLMVIYTPRLCNDVAFLPPQENRAHSISCAPVGASSPDTALPSTAPHHGSTPTDVTVPDAADDGVPPDFALPAALAAAQGTSTPLPTIGGTVVGAKQLVGQPGSVIEKSVVVGGGKETLLGTVASSDGRGREKTMTAEQLRALDIKDPRDVDDLKRKLGKLAGRKAWRLELVDTPRGREFRGIIESDDGEDEEGGDGGDDDARGARDGDAEYEWEDVEVEWGDDEDEGEGEGSEETFFREEL